MFDTWSPDSGTVWEAVEALGDGASLEKVGCGDQP